MGGGSWNPIRNVIESAASLAGNYELPGSSLLTDNLVSKGSQAQLGSTLGEIAQAGTGAAGGGLFGSGLQSAGGALESSLGSSLLSSVGNGLTSGANSLGGLFGDGTLGSDISQGASNLGSSASSKFSSLFGSGTPTDGVTPANSSISGSGSALGTGGGSSAYSPAGSATATGSSFDPTKNILDTSALSNFSSDLGPASAAPSISSQIGSGIVNNPGTSTLSSLLKGSNGINLLGTALGAGNSYLANQNAQKDLLTSQTNALGQLQPYLATGAGANSKLSDLLGTSGNTTASGYGSLGQPFTPGDLTQTPGYQFELQQGDQALARKQSASGDYFSGAALKAAQDYGQGLAGTTYNDAYNQYLQQQQQQYGMLAGQSGTGLSAANAAAGVNTNIGNAQANAGISSSNIVNQTLSSLLSGAGAKKPVNIGGQIVYI